VADAPSQDVEDVVADDSPDQRGGRDPGYRQRPLPGHHDSRDDHSVGGDDHQDVGARQRYDDQVGPG
jgi:hypothetical protein